VSQVDRELLDRVVAAVKRVCAEQIMPRFQRVAHQRKADGSLFTEADLAAQEALASALNALRALPMVAEEMGEAQQLQRWESGADGLWCVDPIDGTSNFVHGVPNFSVSVALIERGRSVLGVVYQPIGDEAFCAGRGLGASLNGERLALRASAPALRGALACVDFKRLPARLASALAAQPPYSSQRNLGSGALEWCYAAAGRFDVYLHGGQKPWDYAAGWLIHQEAGGSACTFAHDEFWDDALWQRPVIAALDPGLFAQWRDWIRARAMGSEGAVQAGISDPRFPDHC
jgi:myo-inositol-1(or 4)-monophosphatase